MKILRIAIWVNFCWAVLVVILFGLRVSIGWDPGESNMDYLALFLAALAYAGISFAAVDEKHWALLICVVSSAAILVISLPWVAYNFFAFLTNDPLYRESPGTILVVGISAALFCVHSSFLGTAYFLSKWRSKAKF